MTKWRGGGGAGRRGNSGVSRTVGGVQPQVADSDERVPPQQRREDFVEAPAHEAEARVVRRADVRRRERGPAEAGGRDDVLVGGRHGLKKHCVCGAAGPNWFAGGLRAYVGEWA